MTPLAGEVVEPLYREGTGLANSYNQDALKAARRAARAERAEYRKRREAARNPHGFAEPFRSPLSDYERQQARSLLPAPNPGPQAAFLECPIKDVFYGGARFGGKTFALLLDFAGHALKWGKAALGVLFRRTYPELEEVIRISREIYTPLGWRYNESTHVWTTGDGGFLKLRYLRKTSDADGYQGHSYSWIGFDECGNWPDFVAQDKLLATLRSRDIPPEWCHIRRTGNPGGPGHGPLKARYIDGHDPFTPFRYVLNPDLPDKTIEAVFIPATLDDNQAAVGTYGSDYYETQLAGAGDTALYKAWRYGDWEVFVGQAFPLARDAHIVPVRQLKPTDLQLAGLDWGFNHGWIGVVTRDADQRWEVAHEVYFEQLYAYDAAQGIAKRWDKAGLKPTIIFYDDQMDQDSGVAAGLSIVGEFRRGLQDHYGVDAEGNSRAPVMHKAAKGPGSRKTKYQLMHKLVKYTREKDGSILPWHRPHLLIQSRCKHLIRTLFALPDDPDKPREDVDTDAEDHPYDGLCNVLLSEARSAEQKDKPDRVKPDRSPGLTRQGKRKPADDILRPGPGPIGEQPGGWLPRWSMAPVLGDEPFTED